jgi:hypothetical protein
MAIPMSPMHGTTNTCRSFPTSLKSHRNKPHSIRSPGAPEIYLDILALLLFMVWRRVRHFWQSIRWFIAKPESSLGLSDGLSFGS